MSIISYVWIILVIIRIKMKIRAKWQKSKINLNNTKLLALNGLKSKTWNLKLLRLFFIIIIVLALNVDEC